MGDVLAFRRRRDAAPAGDPLPRRKPPSGNSEHLPRDHDPLWRELVGQVLRDARADRRETQRQVADRAGISVQYLSEIERGRKEPSSEMLAAVGGALGLPLIDLTRAVGRRLIRTTGRPTGPVALAA